MFDQEPCCRRLGEPIGDDRTASRVVGQPDTQAPQPIVHTAHQGPGPRPFPIKRSRLDQLLKMAIQTTVGLNRFQPSPQQLGQAIFRVAAHHFGVNRQPGFTSASQDIGLVQIIVDQQLLACGTKVARQITSLLQPAARQGTANLLPAHRQALLELCGHRAQRAEREWGLNG